MTITLHMVTSLDGFIAKRDNDVSWMVSTWDSYNEGIELTSEMATEVIESIDCYIMGSHTYELALTLGWPYGDTRTIVVSQREFPSNRESVEFYSGDLDTLVKHLEKKNAWLVGGALLCQEFLRLKLVETICLSIVPILLGDGISLFSGSEHKLHLVDITAFKNGMIDLWYDILPHSG